MVFKIVTLRSILFFLFNDTRQNGPSDWKFSKASSKDNRSLFVFLCKSKFNLNLGFTIVCLSNEMIYKYSFQIFIYGEIVLFLHHTTNHVQITYSSKSALFYFSLIRFCRKYQDSPLYLSCFMASMMRLETEVFGLKFKKSSRTCSWIW
jgi:hypothetical protein